MKKLIKEDRVLKSSQPTLENMVRVLVDALKAEGFDVEASKNSGAKTTCIDVAEFEKNIELTLEKGAKYKIVPKMDEIDFDLEGKGMEAFKEDAEDLAKELATKLDKDYEDKNLKESFNEDVHVKLISLEQIRKCLDKGIDVFIDDVGPFGEGTAHVIDTTINTDTAKFDQDTLSDFGYLNESEFWENEKGAKAIVIDEKWGQSGCNFCYLDAYNVEDFGVYVSEAELKESGVSLDDETAKSDGYTVKIIMQGPTGEWDQVGYASHLDDVDFDEGTVGWRSINNVYAIPKEAAKELLIKIIAKAEPVEEFRFSIIPYVKK